MVSNNLLRRRVYKAALSMGVGTLVVMSTPATLAQSNETSGSKMEEVIVTGSRIPLSPNMTAISPIQTVSEEELKSRGTSDISDYLNTLPQVFQNAATDFSNTSNQLSSPGGMTTANLRGLGPQRTLVMVDGKRLGPADPSTGNPNPGPDLDQIPTALVESVEVLTGGASAVYGSDAVAGVVNFKLKRNFEGIQFDGNYGFNQHHNHNYFMQELIRDSGEAPPKSNVTDGYNKDFSLTLGHNFDDDRGNITIYAGYRTANPVYQRNRDFAACQYNRGDLNNPITASNSAPACNGSPNSNLFETVPAPNTVDPADYSVVGNQLLPYPQAGSNPPALFNSNRYIGMSRDDRRTTYGGFLHYDVVDAFKPYVEVMAMHDKSLTQVAPSALFFGSYPYSDSGAVSINCDNPLLSAQERAIVCDPTNVDPTTGEGQLYVGRRNVEGAGRSSTYTHKNVRTVIGAKGDFASAWNYDVYGQLYVTTYRQLDANYLSWTHINNALHVVDVNGVPTCTSVVDGTDPNCVPYNIFTEGGVTPAQVAYLNSTSTQTGEVRQKIVAANVGGDLGHYGIKLPSATDGIAVSIGGEYRSETLRYTPDANAGTNDLSGYGGQATPIDGGYHVREVYGELSIPLVQHYAWAETLSLNPGIRYSDYSNFGGVTTYKFAAEYAPIRDLTFRGSFQHAIRAPNVIELYTPASVTNTSELSGDPCAGPFDPSLAAGCANTGAGAQYGHITQCPSNQCAVLQGGNSDLKPETSNTVTLGFVFRPSWLDGFEGSIDYYRITLKDTIGTIPLKFTFNTCLQTGDPFYCSLVKRTSSGFLFGTTISGGGYIVGNNLNIGELKVSGIDVQASYRWSIGAFGRMGATFGGAYLNKNISSPAPGVPTYDCAGLYGNTCQTLNPRWRHTLRLAWYMPANVTVALNWRYIGKVSLESNTSDPTLTNGAYDPFNAELGPISYFDLSGSWEVIDGITIRAGVNNIFDKDPPLVDASIAGTGSPNSYPTYDLLGRQIFLGLTAKFK